MFNKLTKYLRVTLLISVCFLSSAGGFAQDLSEDYFRVYYANDFFRARDLYFTQGVRLEMSRQDWAFLFTREGFTPSSIADPEIRVGDHPYAGITYAGVRRTWKNVTTDANDRLFVQGFLGVMGPVTGGKQEQTTIHRWIDDELPMGWDNQIANDLALDVMAGCDRLLFRNRYLDLEAGALARLGTYRTRANVHGQLRIGIVEPRLTKKGKSFSIVYRVSPVAQLVGYDASLQGGVFNDKSPYTVRSEDIARVVGRIHTSVDARLGGFGASFGHTYQTRRFNTIEPHAWGEITLVWYGKKVGRLLRGEIGVN